MEKENGKLKQIQGMERELELELELNDLKAVVRTMRQAQKVCMAWDNAMASGYELTEEEWDDYGRSQATRELFEKEVDEYLKEE